MDNNFIRNLLSWDYANLAKSAAEHGGPQKFVNVIYKAGQADVLAKVGLFAVVAVIGVLNPLFSNGKTKLKRRRRSNVSRK